MFVRTPMIFESQDATKITSALADSFIYLFTKVMRLYMCMVVVVTMPTSRPIGVCRVNNLYQEPFLEDCFQGRRAMRFWTRRWRRWMAWYREHLVSSVGLLNIITSLVDHYCDVWKRWTWRVYRQLVSLLFLFLPWSVRPLRNMCGKIENIDLDWMNGATCHHFQHYKDSEGMMYRGDFKAITSPMVTKDVMIWV